VQRPGIYQVAPNETLSGLLLRAGGLTQNAYLFGSSFYREEVRKQQTENLEKLLRRLEAESASSLAQVAQSGGGDLSALQAKLATASMVQRQSLERVRSLKVEGRISLSLPASLRMSLNELPVLACKTQTSFTFLQGQILCMCLVQ